MTPGESIQLDRVPNETGVIDGDDLENPSQMINIELVSITRKEELPDEVEATKKAFSTPIQRIQLSLDSKNTGNHHYYLKNYQLAKTYYENSLRYLQDSEEWTSEFQKNANSLRVSVLLNISNCLNKLGDHKSVLKYCSDAIKIEKDNIKALYLRAISNMNLDDPEEARVDLYRAASIQPQNIQIRKKLSEVIKVILRAPKSQIPLHMTVNDAKYGDKNVLTTLDVVESDEIVRWVNDSAEFPEPVLLEKEEIISLNDDKNTNPEDSKKKISSDSPKYLKDLDETTHSCRHKYKNINIKDIVPANNITNNEDNKNDIFNNESNVKSEIAKKYERLLSGNLGELNSNSGMGAFSRTKYNGKEMISNIRSKPLFKSIFKNFKSYGYNKRFKSNESHDSSEYITVDQKVAEVAKTKIISKKIQDEIDATSKVGDAQKDILKTFKNLTISPSPYLSDTKNVNDKTTESPKTRSLPLSCVLSSQYKNNWKNSPTNNMRSKSPVSLPTNSIQNTSSNSGNDSKIVDGDFSFDDLSKAISKLNFELSNTSSVLDSFLNKYKRNSIDVYDSTTKNILEQLYDLELFYNKIHFLLLNKKSIDDYLDLSNTNNCEYKHYKDPSNSNKIPNTNLPHLNNSSNNTQMNNPILNSNKEENKHIFIEKNPSLSSIDSKRSLSVPIHEEEFIDNNSSYYDNNEYYDYDNKNPNTTLKDKSKPVNSTPYMMFNNNKVPQSKVGLKPKSSFEGFSSQGEVSRGRTKIRDQNGSVTRVSRNFVVENKVNVLQNARKSSSSLQILSNDKRASNNPKRNTTLPYKNQTNLQNGKSSSSLSFRNQSLEYNRLGRSNDTYPSLEVGGPIAKMNCFPKYMSCLQNNSYPQFKCYQPSHQYKTEYGLNHNYFYQNHEIDYVGGSTNTKRCPFFCNMIAHN
ncbi:hypothetical protein RS030_6894 [Cryptosporidium xiaoi]|uniref:TPR repeat-containing protein n=1 Tax=Cryptosporidium xiaoi TaxID=659607 RepID=A0AAV9XUR2_9CRYT